MGHGIGGFHRARTRRVGEPVAEAEDVVTDEAAAAFAAEVTPARNAEEEPGSASAAAPETPALEEGLAAAIPGAIPGPKLRRGWARRRFMDAAVSSAAGRDRTRRPAAPIRTPSAGPSDCRARAREGAASEPRLPAGRWRPASPPSPPPPPTARAVRAAPPSAVSNVALSP